MFVWTQVPQWRWFSSAMLLWMNRGWRERGAIATKIWRRGWDLNPRYPLRYVRFRGGSFQPLTHLSAPRCKSFGKYRSSSFIIPSGVCPNRLVPVAPRCLQPRFFQSNIALKDHLYRRSLFQPYIASSAKQDCSKSGNGSDTRPDTRSLESARSQAA